MNKQQDNLQWDAKWIWGGDVASPRNEWWCFRKTFEVPLDGWNKGNVSITADSRYALYVNGVQVGRGPVRSWPFEQSYDTYDIAHLLRPGQANTLAVLVQHFGLSTFYYVRGRGGLLVQLDLTADGGNVAVGAEGVDKTDTDVALRIVTDRTWKTTRHLGQDSRASRMSCQHAFTERIAAAAWDEHWIDPVFADSEWDDAHVVGEVGCAPWTTLKPRDIPPLTEGALYPVRIESLNRVVPLVWTSNLDLRCQMVPGCEDDANEYVYAGYAATVIRAAEAAQIVIGFPYTPPHFSALIVNGVRVAKKDIPGHKSERYLETRLQAGDNLILIELVGKDHGRGLFMGIDCDAPFELAAPVLSGVAGVTSAPSPFVTIGPFECYEYIDHQFGEEARVKHQTVMACGEIDSSMQLLDLGPEALRIVEAFRQARAATRVEQLEPLCSWIRPMPAAFISQESILTLAAWKKHSEPLPVPNALQPVVAAHAIPGIVPVFAQADTEMILDFGTQAVGYITFKLEAEAGVIVDFYGFEHMRDGWVQHMNYLDNSLRYICRQGRQQFTSYVRRGFRYLMVTVRGATKPMKIYNIHLLQSHYPVAEIGQFHSSDPLLNDIWRISQTTTRLCMEDTFVDCPAYEQTFWVGDARNEALVAYYLFGSEEMVKRSLELVPGSRGQTPLYADQVPSGWNSVIPNWTFFWVIACREYYTRTGDRAFAEAVWPHTAYTLDRYLELIDERGLLYMNGWNLLDWAPIDQPREGVVAHQNMFLVRALRSAAELAELAGAAREAAAYRAEADALTQAVNDYLWFEEQQAYLDCIHADGRLSTITSMQTQVVAYLCDIASGSRRTQLESYLLQAPTHFVPIGSPFMSFFYYEALTKMGAYRQMLDDMREQYGQMIDYGATTCWEMYPKRAADGSVIEQELTRSHCHAWSAAPAYFLGTSVLGVKEAAPGWSAVTVQPELCGLSWARGSVPLPERGRVDVSWQLDASGQLHLDVQLPGDVQADVRLPDGVEGTIQVRRIGGRG